MVDGTDVEQQQQVQQPLQLPRTPTQEWVNSLQQSLQAATWQGVEATQHTLPKKVLAGIISKVTSLLKREPTLLEITPSATTQQQVTVVGDTHGHFLDVCRLFEQFGAPSADRVFIFNGDYVDRGAWGVELLTLLLAYKWLLPQNVFLLRGNHEGAWCTKVYGFKNEIMAKYGAAGKSLYKEVKQLFAELPLAALVEHSTLILHGGLFRAPLATGRKLQALLAAQQPTSRLGTLQDLREASKGGLDADAERYAKHLVASDVMWSDPSRKPGHHPNEQRGVGTTFGADVTEAFLSHNQVKLIIRSHEGPDARAKRSLEDEMPSVDKGYAVDHQTESGQLVTLFSAPCYPQFMADGEEPFLNQGAVLHLSAPDYATPVVECFEAVLPRPEITAFFTPDALFSDDSQGESEDEERLSSSSVSHGAAPVEHASAAPSSTAAGAAAGAVVAAAGAASGAADDEPNGAPVQGLPLAAAAAAPTPLDGTLPKRARMAPKQPA